MACAVDNLIDAAGKIEKNCTRPIRRRRDNATGPIALACAYLSGNIVLSRVYRRRRATLNA